MMDNLKIIGMVLLGCIGVLMFIMAEPIAAWLLSL